MVIPPGKGATALDVQVGINDPEVRIGGVDAKHGIRSTADANGSVCIRANQLIRLDTAPRWITLPTEWIRYIAKTTAGEIRRTNMMMMSPANI
jgi:hypothetical protein